MGVSGCWFASRGELAAQAGWPMMRFWARTPAGRRRRVRRIAGGFIVGGVEMEVRFVRLDGGRGQARGGRTSSFSFAFSGRLTALPCHNTTADWSIRRIAS